MDLTKKQVEIIEYIENFISIEGCSPTYREIMAGLGYKSVSTVAKHIDNLVAIGKLEKSDGGEARSVSIKKYGREFMDDTEKFVMEFLEARADEFEKRGEFSKHSRILAALNDIWPQ